MKDVRRRCTLLSWVVNIQTNYIPAGYQLSILLQWHDFVYPVNTGGGESKAKSISWKFECPFFFPK